MTIDDYYIGFESRKTWKNKPYFWTGTVYYDGLNYFAIHLGWFYLNIVYY